MSGLYLNTCLVQKELGLSHAWPDFAQAAAAIAIRTVALWLYLLATGMRGVDFFAVRLGQLAYSFVLVTEEQLPTPPRVYQFHAWGSKTNHDGR